MNVLLDLLFVVVLGLGVNGAACATVISQGSSAIACMIFAFSQSSEIRLKMPAEGRQVNDCKMYKNGTSYCGTECHDCNFNGRTSACYKYIW